MQMLKNNQDILIEQSHRIIQQDALIEQSLHCN